MAVPKSKFTMVTSRRVLLSLFNYRGAPMLFIVKDTLKYIFLNFPPCPLLLFFQQYRYLISCFANQSLLITRTHNSLVLSDQTDADRLDS